jgi:hypothetical protein
VCRGKLYSERKSNDLVIVKSSWRIRTHRGTMGLWAPKRQQKFAWKSDIMAHFLFDRVEVLKEHLHYLCCKYFRVVRNMWTFMLTHCYIHVVRRFAIAYQPLRPVIRLGFRWQNRCVHTNILTTCQLKSEIGIELPKLRNLNLSSPNLSCGV